MPRLLLLPLLAALALPSVAAAATERATFKVSLYGIQRYEQVSVRQERPDDFSFDERGTYTTRSEVKLHTVGPSRAVLTRTRGSVSVRWLGGTGGLLPVEATFVHSGSDDREVVEGLSNGQPHWVPVPPPLERNCTKTLDLGVALDLSGERVTAQGAGGLVVPLGDPFNGCPWGDRSGGLYTAKGRLSLDALLNGRETEVVLRGRWKDDSKDPLVSTRMRKSTTVYVTFKKVGGN